MPDGYAMLEHEHRHVEERFDDYEQSGDDAIAEDICALLTAHGELEQQVLYPRLRSFGDRTEQLADNAQEAHDDIEHLVGRVRLAASDERVGLIEELWAKVDAHVREEETEIFPEMRDLGVDGESLGRELEAARG
jgi:hemerythrin superfamily protein